MYATNTKLEDWQFLYSRVELRPVIRLLLPLSFHLALLVYTFGIPFEYFFLLFLVFFREGGKQGQDTRAWFSIFGKYSIPLHVSEEKKFYGKDINGYFDSNNFKKIVIPTSNLIGMC